MCDLTPHTNKRDRSREKSVSEAIVTLGASAQIAFWVPALLIRCDRPLDGSFSEH
jgi:hypothetical protein